MTIFETLFGMRESQVKNTCILMPLARKDILRWLGVRRLSKGKLYSTGNSNYFTAIQTGIGPALLGDAVLYLEQTGCQNIILFGSCGLVEERKNLNIGNLVAPDRCYSSESFTEALLENGKDAGIFDANKSLLENFLKINGQTPIKKVTCATLGSLKLEENYTDIFKERQIQIVDMECSALFSSSKYIKKRAMALLYITDIINKKPFYRNFSTRDKLSLFGSIKSASHILCNFIEKNLNV